MLNILQNISVSHYVNYHVKEDVASINHGLVLPNHTGDVFFPASPPNLNWDPIKETFVFPLAVCRRKPLSQRREIPGSHGVHAIELCNSQ